MAKNIKDLSKSLRDNLDLTAYSQVGHTHQYAGSSTVGGSATSAVKLATARAINGTNFDGTAAITTAKWGTARTLTIGNSGKSVDGSDNVSWTLTEIGAAATSHTHNYAGSSSAGGAANSVANNLTIKLNSGTTEGTNLFTFNGSAAKSINITPSAIGAAGSSHGTHVTYSTATPLVAGTGAVGTASNVARGDHVHPAQTSVSGNAGTATKLATARNITIGNKTNSFDGSANISYTLSDIGALPLSGGTMTGVITTPNNSQGIKIGDDAYLCDRNIADHIVIEGNTATNGGITFGSGKDTNIYRGSANLLKTDDTFNAVGGLQWNGESLDTRYAKASHGSHISFSTATPKVAGTAAVGSDSGAARGDHVHPAQTSVSGNAGTATKLQTARTITIGNKSNNFDGSANITYTIADIGAAPASHDHQHLLGEDLSNKTLTLNDLNLSSGTPKFKVYFCPTDGNGSNITGRPNDNSKQAFNLIVESLRWASTTDYITKQTYTQGSQKIVYIRYCTSGTWTAWEKVYTSAQKPTASDIGAAASSHGTHVTYSTSTPLVAGTGAVGTASNVARGDHVHPAQTSVSGNAGTATKLATARTITIGSTGKTFDGSANVSWTAAEMGVLPMTGNTGAYSMTGNVEFASAANGTFRGVVGKCGVNDYWRVVGNATADNAGYMEIATADDGTEPIYVRQYTGVYTTVTRTLTLLDGSGNTSMPGSLSVTKGVSCTDVTAKGNVTVTGTVKVGSVTMKYNDTSESLDFIFG